MVEHFLFAALTAVLSSILTLALAWYAFRHHLQERLDAALSERLQDLGEIIEQRVRKGVLDAVADIPSTDVIKDTTRTMTRTGASLLSVLMGGPLKGSDDEGQK